MFLALKELQSISNTTHLNQRSAIATTSLSTLRFYSTGAGGEDASLSAVDIFKMYERYSQKKGWKFDVIDLTESDLRGYKEASAAISGAGVYVKLKFESGIHGVQVDVQFEE
ncbi:uncharacterized protein LOC116133763 isoform X2 [Pistacia vera]|uniref:uncharacterized protein LOC116133763 isoform X2 n=1 Tax=Pistacia vera TaxID=55513 RepID=UPI00126313B0|nr:uncharacterized protein LOC116133763 isoform X2 [Pistacia vera]